MKSLFSSLFIVAALFSSCGEKENGTPVPEPEVPATMTVSPTSYEAPLEGGEFTVSVTSPTRPTAVSGQSWVTVTDGTYSNYKIAYPVKVASNETYESRTAVVTIKSGAFSQDVTVSQPGKEKTTDPDEVQIPEEGDNEAWKMARKLGLGLNIGNQMDAFDSKSEMSTEGYWTNGQKLTKAVFTSLKAKGFKSVRIPVTWLGHIGAAPDYRLDDRLDRVAELVA